MWLPRIFFSLGFPPLLMSLICFASLEALGFFTVSSLLLRQSSRRGHSCSCRGKNTFAKLASPGICRTSFQAGLQERNKRYCSHVWPDLRTVTVWADFTIPLPVRELGLAGQGDKHQAASSGGPREGFPGALLDMALLQACAHLLCMFSPWWQLGPDVISPREQGTAPAVRQGAMGYTASALISCFWIYSL